MSIARRVDKLLARLAAMREPRPSARRWLVVAGDSLCTGRAPSMLRHMLRGVGADVGVVRAARGGTAARHLCALVERCGRQELPGSVAAVIILAGGNDARRECAPTKETIAASLYRCLDEIAVQWPEASAILCTVPIPGRHPALRADAPAILASLINPSIRQVAHTRGAVLCDLETVFEGSPGARSDGVHPTASGDRLLAEKWFQAVWPRLTRATEP
ncbi:SGNH/GDSL hydrolase family protein [Candidatus Fermentibacteria bacterium]|nr:SGNH/GDSL hydrolase family protein [Candidatus Fermentibacteria bacterium]